MCKVAFVRFMRELPVAATTNFGPLSGALWLRRYTCKQSDTTGNRAGAAAHSGRKKRRRITRLARI